MSLLKIKRDELLKPLQTVIGIVERRHTLPILSNVLIEKSTDQLALTATDLEIQILTRVNCDATSDEFSITVSAKKLQDICRAFTEDTSISFDKDDSKILVKAGKSRFSLQTLPAADFPKLAALTDTKCAIAISQKIFKELLDKIQYAMAVQDIRYYLNGLLLIIEPGAIKLVATDGHRLAMVAHDLPQLSNVTNIQEVILPRKSIIELVKLLADSDDEVNIEIGQNQVRFEFSNTVMSSKIVEGKFPDYNKVIPTNYQNNFTIERIILLQALQRAAILSNEKFSGVRLVLTENCLRILCSNNEQEEAQEELEIDYAGILLDIGFNIKYLLDVLNNLNDEKITCSFGDVNSSGLITVPGNEKFKYVVMPMRI
ncbi:MAG: DNA polymerase III subunit beta [Sulfuricellaceae bacterium]